MKEKKKKSQKKPNRIVQIEIRAISNGFLVEPFREEGSYHRRSNDIFCEDADTVRDVVSDLLIEM